MSDKTVGLFPASGTAVLAAASRIEPAVTESGAEYTMFSEALIETLTAGIAGKDQFLSLRDVGEHTSTLIRRKFGLTGVQPEVHSPRQINGDLATIELFPNPAFNPAPTWVERFSAIPPTEWTRRGPSNAFLARLYRMFDDTV